MNKKHTIITTVLVVLLVVALAIAAWAYVSLRQARMEAERSAQTLADQQAADAAQKEADLESKLKLTWPSKGSQLCYEHQYGVSWQAPQDMEIVSLNLYTPDSSVKLGDYPAVTGTGGDLGYGSFQWDLTDTDGNVVPASQVYKISISGAYHGHTISTTTDGVFSIGNCM